MQQTHTESRSLRRILLLAFFVRCLPPLLALLAGQGTQAFHARDTSAYLVTATQLARSAEFASNGHPEILRTPGYPLLLVPGVWLGWPEMAAVVLQIALGCATVYLVYMLALLAGGTSRAAAVAACLAALEPLSVIYASLVLTETLFAFLVVLCLWLLGRHLAGASVGWLLGAAGTAAAAAYVRPIAYYLPALLSLLLLGRGLRPDPGRRARVVHAGAFLFVAAGLLGAWQVRNLASAGYPGFSAVQDVNLYFYQGASVLAAQQGLPFATVQDGLGYRDEEVYLAAHPEQRDWGPGRRYRAMGAEGTAIVLAHPLTYAAIHVRGMLRALLDPEAIEYLRLVGRYPRAGGLLGRVLDGGMLAGLRSLYREHPAAFWASIAGAIWLLVYLLLAGAALRCRALWSAPVGPALVASGIYLLVLAGGPQALGRFRHPVMPLVCVLAGIGAAACGRWRPPRTAEKPAG